MNEWNKYIYKMNHIRIIWGWFVDRYQNRLLNFLSVINLIINHLGSHRIITCNLCHNYRECRLSEYDPQY